MCCDELSKHNEVFIIFEWMPVFVVPLLVAGSESY